jgi:hypothetical protein
MREEFRVAEQPLMDREEMKVRPGNVLVAIRDPRNLYYLATCCKHGRFQAGRGGDDRAHLPPRTHLQRQCER